MNGKRPTLEQLSLHLGLGNPLGKKRRCKQVLARNSSPRDVSNELPVNRCHVDPEYPTPPKKGLRHLTEGDLLIFYAGLQGFEFESPPALYIIGYFAGSAFDQLTARTSRPHRRQRARASAALPTSRRTAAGSSAATLCRGTRECRNQDIHPRRSRRFFRLSRSRSTAPRG